MKFNNITQIQNHKFKGYHFGDFEAFNAIEKFVKDETNLVADRAEALRVMSDKGMGLGRDEEINDAALLVSYLADH